MRIAPLTLPLLLVLLSGSRCESGSDVPLEQRVTVRGRLTDEGAECPTLRDRNNVLYSLAGSTEGFKHGDRVCVKGRRVDASICQRGITITVEWIGQARFCPP